MINLIYIILIPFPGIDQEGDVVYIFNISII